MPYVLYVLAAIEILRSLVGIADIDKPRKPVTRSTAIGRVIVSGTIAVLLCIAATSLH